MSYEERLLSLGIFKSELLVPASEVDYSKYSVIACDQYTSEVGYWERAAKIAEGSPSSLNMVFPEVYLPKYTMSDAEKISKTMRKYLLDGALRSIGENFVIVRRNTSAGVRSGLVVTVDLERYNYSPGSRSIIRATERTIEERLPIRVEIRKHAPLESSHVMLLIDDPKNTVIGKISSEWDTLEKLYDFDLMQGAGRISGRKVSEVGVICESLEALKKKSEGMLFAVGDGNHSLAAAKLHWEFAKVGLNLEQRKTSKARFAMVEIVNLHDPGLAFHPIHRVIFGVSKDRFDVCDPENPLPLQDLQPKIDKWLIRHPEARIDYIHGKEEALKLAKAEDAIAILMPEFDKSTLFSDVRKNGALVKKSFSMGEAKDKRHYLEVRKII